MSAYLHAVGGIPVHVGALTDFLRTRAEWLRIDTVRNVSGSWDVCLRVGGPYATPAMAFEAARHARDFCGVPIGTTPDETNHHDEGADPCPMICPMTWAH